MGRIAAAVSTVTTRGDLTWVRELGGFFPSKNFLSSPLSQGPVGNVSPPL